MNSRGPGTGHGIVQALSERLQAQRDAGRVELRFAHRVTELVREGGRLVGCAGTDGEGRPFELRAGDALVIAAGSFAWRYSRPIGGTRSPSAGGSLVALKRQAREHRGEDRVRGDRRPQRDRRTGARPARALTDPA